MGGTSSDDEFFFGTSLGPGRVLLMVDGETLSQIDIQDKNPPPKIYDVAQRRKAFKIETKKGHTILVVPSLSLDADRENYLNDLKERSDKLEYNYAFNSKMGGLFGTIIFGISEGLEISKFFEDRQVYASTKKMVTENVRSDLHAISGIGIAFIACIILMKYGNRMSKAADFLASKSGSVRQSFQGFKGDKINPELRF